MSEGSDGSTIRSYLRLLAFARGYAGRITVGVVAGLLAGGSIFPLLSASEQLFRPFDAERKAGVEAAAVSDGQAAAPARRDAIDRMKETAERFGIPATTPDGRMSWQFMLLTIVALPIVVLVRSVAVFLNRYYVRWGVARIVLDVRDALFSGLQRQSLAYFGKSDTGQLISRVSNDANVVEMVVSAILPELTRAPVEILASAVYIVAASIKYDMAGLVAGVLVAFPLCIVPIVWLGRRVRRHTQRALERISVLISRMHENFTGIKVVKAFDMEAAELARFKDMNAQYFRSIIRALKAELFMTPFTEGVTIVLGIVFLVICFARGVKFSQIMPIGIACVMAYRPVRQLAKIHSNIERGAAALNRIFAVLDTDTSLSISANPVKITGFRDRIAFEDVDFRYESDGELMLRDICLTIPAGSVVALVGETGSGKTTLANLLARFYDPTSGRVTLDGVDLREADPATLRRLMGIVSQETVLFNDTIANNIAYGCANASRGAIEEAARQANAHEFIMAAPGGYDRCAGEKGVGLSGGERQRLAIARAILRNPPILILDEATSALDTVTERLVQEAIARVMADRTVLAIAHRLSTIRHANLICLLDKGRIVERGTHDELYAAGGRYRRLCDMQILDMQ